MTQNTEHKGTKHPLAAVILAAGRGSRMKALTADTPKCLLELAGRPLLHWQIDALRTAGVENIHVVTGYQGQRLREQAETWGFTTAENPEWEHTNMLSTLLCANRYVRDSIAQGLDRVIVAYADIVYAPAHIRALAAVAADMAITYDTQWEALWRLRFGDPLLDAETFLQEDGCLRDIGGKPRSMEDIHGQYMGLLAFTSAGWEALCRVCADLGDRVATTDMTAFLRELLRRKIPVAAVPVAGKWAETDCGDDRERYEAQLRQGHWSHDWRTDE